MGNIVKISMKPVSYYSKLDELSLVRNLRDIPSVENVIYVDCGMEFEVDKAICDWNQFKDILSLFIRYEVDINQLKTIVPDEEVEAWFLAPERKWHKRLVASD